MKPLLFLLFGRFINPHTPIERADFNHAYGMCKYVEVKYVLGGRLRTCLIATKDIIPSRKSYLILHDYPVTMVDLYMSASDILKLFQNDSIEEREKHEKFLAEKSVLLGKLCDERGIELWKDK